MVVDLHAPATLTPVYFGQEARWAAQPGEPRKIKLLAATCHRTQDSLVFRSEVHYQTTQITNLIYSNYTLPSFPGDDGNKKLAIPCVLGYGLPGGGLKLLFELSRSGTGTHPTSYTIGAGDLPRGQSGRGVMSTTHLHLLLRTRLHGLQRDTTEFTIYSYNKSQRDALFLTFIW